ncbi:PAQR family membrane homeostasis protein TrhA [Myxococcus qinghaiensis]|uniref:PAQR family membrane homeostasis protein TrhA n=1 Tax=Myxococcus qinghaiensis TaxID=2906758 RepID=UPI0020A7EDD5|nr:hemolysin III family protein [Myxococcus qinghaiensis]MCP3162889.1 hemolysin III family protein [Myxococcus qinghaiensis]
MESIDPPGTRALLADVKPRLRGVSHALAFLAALCGCFVLAIAPAQGTQQLADWVFGLSLVLMFGTSATYHVPTWGPVAYQRLRRLDHAAIYLLIAGTFTPLATLDAPGAWTEYLLWVMWACALTGAGLSLFGISGPRGLRSVLYTVLGTLAAPVMLRLPGVIGAERASWLLFGGALYAVGAVVYARKWPDPHPSVFGYHEVFHLLVIAGASTHYAVLIDFLWNR